MAKRLHAADPGQPDVHQDERRLVLTRQLNAFFARSRLNCAIALELMRVAHELQVLRAVFDDEDQLIRHGALAP